jgi:hypothetical protein
VPTFAARDLATFPRSVEECSQRHFSVQEGEYGPVTIVHQAMAVNRRPKHPALLRAPSSSGALGLSGRTASYAAFVLTVCSARVLTTSLVKANDGVLT